eukprot:s1982_g1.t1
MIKVFFPDSGIFHLNGAIFCHRFNSQTEGFVLCEIVWSWLNPGSTKNRDPRFSENCWVHSCRHTQQHCDFRKQHLQPGQHSPGAKQLLATWTLAQGTREAPRLDGRGLRYSKTFIDVEEVNESSAEQRTCSAPPVMVIPKNTPSKFVLHEYEERRISLQVSNLQQGSQLLAGEKLAICGEVNLSRGSYGHPNVCARPCILFLWDKCFKGDKCGFCHLPHETRPPTLDKQQRDYLKELPKNTFFKMLLPFVRQRVEGTELDAAVVLQLLKSEISVFSKISSADPRRICLVFERMSLAGLVSTACTILPQERFRKVAKNYQSF